MMSWLPWRTSLALAAVAAVAFALLTYGLLRIVSWNAADLAMVRAEAQAELLLSKIESLPEDMDRETRAAEIQTLIVARALEALDGGRCDSRQGSRAIYLLRLPGDLSAGTGGIGWPSDQQGRVRFAVPAGTACMAQGGRAVGVVRALPGGGRLLAAQSYSSDPRLVTGAVALGLAIFILFLIAAMGFAWFLSRQWKHRLEALNALLDRADRTGFSERAETGNGPAEFALLARHLNALLDRSESLVGGLRRLHRHVAHDLRSPIMVARRLLEGAAGGRPDEGDREAIRERLDALDKRCRTLLGIIDAESTTSADQQILVPRDHFRRLIDDMFVYLGDDKELAFDLDADASTVRMNADLFDRVIENILGNAVKFAEPHSRIKCRVARMGQGVRIEVHNIGPTVPAARIDRIFDPGISMASDGTSSHGLGLALVRAAVSRAGGTVFAENVDGGFRVAISLPLPE